MTESQQRINAECHLSNKKSGLSGLGLFFCHMLWCAFSFNFCSFRAPVAHPHPQVGLSLFLKTLNYLKYMPFLCSLVGSSP